MEAFIRLNSVTAVQRFFHQGRHHHRVPDSQTIVQWVQSWKEHGKAANRKSSGMSRTIRTPESVNRVQAEMQ